MNGHVIPYTPIAVDVFKVPKNCIRPAIIFLTRAPFEILSAAPSNLNVTSLIYCSYYTRKLLLSKFNARPDLVLGLSVNCRHKVALCDGVHMWVSLVDAHHCPGSVMYFFEGYFGRILYTGDFRLEPSMFSDKSILPRLLTKPVDALYLDNTFASPRLPFPPRSTSTAEILKLANQHRSSSVILALDLRFRKELIANLSTNLKMKFSVADDCLFDMFQLLDLSHLVDERELDLSRSIRIRRLDSLTPSECAGQNAIVIIPSASLAFDYSNPLSALDNVRVVKYADHSSLPELHSFVAKVRPKTIHPIHRQPPAFQEESYPERFNVDCFAQHLDGGASPRYHIPPSVLDNMHKARLKRKWRRRAKTAADDAAKKSIGKSNKFGTDGLSTSVECTFSTDCSQVKVNISTTKRQETGVRRQLERSRAVTLCTPGTCGTLCWKSRHPINSDDRVDDWNRPSSLIGNDRATEERAKERNRMGVKPKRRANPADERCECFVCVQHPSLTKELARDCDRGEDSKRRRCELSDEAPTRPQIGSGDSKNFDEEPESRSAAGNFRSGLPVGAVKCEADLDTILHPKKLWKMRAECKV